MKVFFAVSLRSANKYSNEYHRIFDCIEKLGYINLNELPVVSDPDSFYKKTVSELQETHIDLSKKIRDADIIT